MTMDKYSVIAKGFKRGEEPKIPKAHDLFYRCAECGEAIPSVPMDSTGCTCRNITIDMACLRLAVRDFTKFEVVRKESDVS